jgi:hypothetical protein
MEHRLEPRNYRHRHSTATLTWTQSGAAAAPRVGDCSAQSQHCETKDQRPCFLHENTPASYDERDPNVIATSRHQRSFLGCNARVRLRNVDCTLFIRRDHKAANSSAVIECQVEGGENSRSKMPRDALACSRNGEDCRQSRMPRERGALVHKLLGVIRNVHKFWQVSAKMAISVQHKTNNTVRSSGR